MDETIPLTNSSDIYHTSTKKITLVISFFIISLITFLTQTEITQYIYSSPKYDFNQPIFLLLLTHGSWALLWPIQLLILAIWKYKENKNTYLRVNEEEGYLGFKNEIKENINLELQSMYEICEIIYNHKMNLPLKTSQINKEIFDNDLNLKTFFTKSIATQYIMKKSFLATLIITGGSLTWYISMIYSSSNDVTAIYNCSAFFAYLFAIPLLKERFSVVKMSSVIIAILGVFVVVYGGNNNNNNDNENEKKNYKLFGNILISIGSICYGYYDVYYKKYLCPPSESHYLINSTKQTLFSNVICTLIGVFSVILLILIILFLHLTGLKKLSLNYPVSIAWYILISVLSNLGYSASMLILYALTSPVLGAVSSLTTIGLVGMFESWVFGNNLTKNQVFGDILIIVGFGVLSFAYWNEIVNED